MDQQVRHVLTVGGGVLLVLPLLAVIVRNQVRTRTMHPRRLLIVPAVLAVLACTDGKLLGRLHSAPAVALLVAGIGAGAALGVARARTMTCTRDGALLAVAGGRATVIWWIISFVIRIALVGVALALGVHEGLGEGMLFALSTIGAQYAVLAWRAGLLTPAKAPAGASA
jgi:hypothetical protein